MVRIQQICSQRSLGTRPSFVTHCVTLDKWFMLFKLKVLHLWNGETRNQFINLGWGLNKINRTLIDIELFRFSILGGSVLVCCVFLEIWLYYLNFKYIDRDITISSYHLCNFFTSYSFEPYSFFILVICASFLFSQYVSSEIYFKFFSMSQFYFVDNLYLMFSFFSFTICSLFFLSFYLLWIYFPIFKTSWDGCLSHWFSAFLLKLGHNERTIKHFHYIYLPPDFIYAIVYNM